MERWNEKGKAWSNRIYCCGKENGERVIIVLSKEEEKMKKL